MRIDGTRTRRPPATIINHLRKISEEFNLGNSLRLCRNPGTVCVSCITEIDFLTKTLGSQSANIAVEWLGPILLSTLQSSQNQEHFIAFLKVLPLEILCHLLYTQNIDGNDRHNNGNSRYPFIDYLIFVYPLLGN